MAFFGRFFNFLNFNSLIFFCLSSVITGSSPEEPAEEPPEGLQPDGAAGGQRLPPPHCRLLPQFDTDHGCGRCQCIVCLCLNCGIMIIMLITAGVSFIFVDLFVD